MTARTYVPPARAVEAGRVVAANLRGQRLKRGWSLVQAAKHLRVTAAALGAHERGQRAVTAGQVHEYAVGYGVPIEALWLGAPQMQPWFSPDVVTAPSPATVAAAHVLDDARAYGRLTGP